MVAYEQALQQLHRAPLADFLAERKRLAGELRAAGDAAGAAQIAKHRRPPTSVWTVNQLYWHARGTFDEMLATAARLRSGDLGARKAYHDAIAKLRQRAAVLLRDAGHGASDATLRRVAMTLAAIAAAGGFDPDQPGALAADRDPPGFEVVGLAAEPIEDEPRAAQARTVPAERPQDEHARRATGESDAARRRAAREQERLEALLRGEREAERKQREAERKQQEAARARRKAELQRVRAALSEARAEVRTREHALTLLEKQLRSAEKAVTEARETVKDLERRLAGLDEVD